MGEKIAQRLTLAEEAWQDAQHLISDRKSYRSGVSRSYYGIFHAAQALIISKGLRAKSHSGLVHLFAEYFVRSEEFDSEYQRIISNAFQFRQVGDYDPVVVISKDEAELAVHQARQFIDRVKDYFSPLSD